MRRRTVQLNEALFHRGQHEAGDVLTVSGKVAARWIAAGLAEEYSPPAEPVREGDDSLDGASTRDSAVDRLEAHGTALDESSGMVEDAPFDIGEEGHAPRDAH